MGELNKDLLMAIYNSDFIFSQQSIYSDTIGIGSPKAKEQGYLFLEEDSISQLYLRNFENTLKLGSILGTGEFMFNLSNIASLLHTELKEDVENSVFLPKARKCKASIISMFKRQNFVKIFFR